MTSDISSRRMLVLHIGLPKTGTTFLQHRVFAASTELQLVHRTLAPQRAELCFALRRLARAMPLMLPFRREQALSQLEAINPEDPRPLLVSDENICMDVRSFWRGGRPTPIELADRLARLAQMVTDRFDPIRVLIGVRGQGHWLASRYAESSRVLKEFSQADFERRVRALCTRPLEGPARWLDYDTVSRAFAARLGEENVRLVSLEQLAASPRRTTAELGRFVGGVALRSAAARRRRNGLATGVNVWRLRSDSSDLHLTPELSALVHRRFAASNARLDPELHLHEPLEPDAIPR
ncbi:MAG: hypothetical protein U1E34_02025 [Amaricoccus sp.]